MKVATMSVLSLVCLMGVILGIHANGYGGGAAYSYYPVSPGYYGAGGGGGGWGNGGFRTYTILNNFKDINNQLKIQYVFVSNYNVVCKIAISRINPVCLCF